MVHIFIDVNKANSISGCVIWTNKMHFSFLIYFDNLSSSWFEYSNYSSSGGSYFYMHHTVYTMLVYLRQYVCIGQLQQTSTHSCSIPFHLSHSSSHVNCSFYENWSFHLSHSRSHENIFVREILNGIGGKGMLDHWVCVCYLELTNVNVLSEVHKHGK